MTENEKMKEMIQMKKAAARGKKRFVAISGIFLGVVVIRFLLALATSSFPTVGIDEFLYYSLARSIATKGQLIFRGQAADYAYILYPLILSPIYALFREGAHFYRLLQLWDIIIMSVSVFPIFYLGKRLLGSEKQAVAATVLAMLLPDFILGELIFSESILYPLFFTLMYCAYVYMDSGSKRCILLIGLLGGLLYSTKPGAVVPAAIFILLTLIHGIAKKHRKELLFAALSLVILASTIAFFWGLARFAFGYHGSVFSIYEAQISGEHAQKLKSLLGVLVFIPYYFILACGIIGFVYPFVSWKQWHTLQKSFWWFIMVSLAVMMIGSAWAVEQVTALNIIHLRYIAMYIPLVFLFCFLGRNAVEKGKASKPTPALITALCILLGYVAVFTLVFGCKIKAQTTNGHAQLSVSILNDDILPVSMQIWGNVIILAICIAAFFLILRCRKTRISGICIGVMTAFMLINSIVGYSLMHRTYYPNLEKDGFAVQQLTEGKPYVYVLSAEGVVDIGVDVHTKQSNCIVYTNDFVNNLQSNNGVYSPYVPEKMRGMVSVAETPDVDTLVVDYDSYPFYKFSKDVTVLSPFDSGTVYVVKFTRGERLVDSSLSNLSSKTLMPGTPGIILVYNDEYLQHPVKIRLQLTSSAAQTLSINSTHEIYSIELSPGEAWYEITFNKPEDAYNFKVQDAPIKLTAYDLVIME